MNNKFLRLVLTSFILATTQGHADVFPAVTRLVDMGSDTVEPYIYGFSFTVTGAGTQSYDYKVPYNMFVTSAEAIFSGQTAGDYITISGVDVDNIYGLGAGTVLGTSVEKYYVTPVNNTKERIDLGYPLKSPKDLYTRVYYTTTNESASVNVRFNIIGHKVLGQ